MRFRARFQMICSAWLFDTTYYLLEVSSVLNTVACIDTTNAVEVIVYPLPEISIGPADVFVNDGIQIDQFSPIGACGKDRGHRCRDRLVRSGWPTDRRVDLFFGTRTSSWMP